MREKGSGKSGETSSDHRRFQRVHFRRDFGASDRITKAFAHWRNHEFSDVFDLSFGGLATSKPSMMELQPGMDVDLTLELGEAPAISAKARVAWVRDFSVGMSFTRLEPQGHLSLRKFLSEKLIGSHLHLMNKDVHPKDANFDLWYSGPKETHLFLKLGAEGVWPRPVLRAEFLLDGERALFDDGEMQVGEVLTDSIIQVLTHAPESFVELHTLLELILKSSRSLDRR